MYFLDMQGSDNDYENRISKEQLYFFKSKSSTKKQANINSSDDTILSRDYSMKRTIVLTHTCISKKSCQNSRATIWYLSDHGQNS